MTSKDAFTEEDWTRPRRAPMVAGMAISIADPGGPIELTKETMASMQATPEETEAFGRWMVAVAQDAANAAKEGGFMGFGAERVSQGEQAMLASVAETFGIAP